MAQSDADKIVRAINALTAELKHHRPPRRVIVGARAHGGGCVEPQMWESTHLREPSLEDPDDSGYDCD